MKRKILNTMLVLLIVYCIGAYLTYPPKTSAFLTNMQELIDIAWTGCCSSVRYCCYTHCSDVYNPQGGAVSEVYWSREIDRCTFFCTEEMINACELAGFHTN